MFVVDLYVFSTNGSCFLLCVSLLVGLGCLLLGVGAFYYMCLFVLDNVASTRGWSCGFYTLVYFLLVV